MPKPFMGTTNIDSQDSEEDRESYEQSEAPEEVLQESQSALANFIEAAMDAVIIINEDQLVTTFNPAAERMFGYIEANIIGQPLSKLLPERFRGNHSDHVRTYGQTKVTTRRMGNLGALFGRRANGEEFPIEVSILQAKISNELVYAAIIRDITERNQKETLLQKQATLAERNRLARELHDAITQTLFSASVIAETTPRIWLKDPALAQQNMENLSFMLRGALAEMRTLLLELRPEALSGQTLDQLLQTLVEAAQTRTRAPISLVNNGNCTLPEDVTRGLYRIAQESINNVLRHAEATEVGIALDCSQSGIELRICDDGRGFNPSTIPAGHFGLGFMAERIEKIGGTLSIDSKPGEGTQIVVRWSE
jgi:PAS domain S-box-containing protein